jgi:hypothetical protein
MFSKVVAQPGHPKGRCFCGEYRAAPCDIVLSPVKLHAMIVTLGFALVMMALAGCGHGTGMERASVGGEVTLDGVPVNEGSIRFIPVKGASGPTAGADILDGEYNIARAKGPSLGTHKVEVYVPRNTGRKIIAPWARQRSSQNSDSKSPKAGTGAGEADPQHAESTEPNLNPMQAGNMVEEWVEAAPPTYNENTILELDVQSGHNTFAVHMKSE